MISIRISFELDTDIHNIEEKMQEIITIEKIVMSRVEENRLKRMRDGELWLMGLPEKSF